MFYVWCLLESSQVFSNSTHPQLLHKRGDEASVFEHLLEKKGAEYIQLIFLTFGERFTATRVRSHAACTFKGE